MEDKITVQIGEEERELFMSYALLNRLTRMVGEKASDIPAIFIDPTLQGDLLREILGPRKNGKIVPGFDIENLDLTPEVAAEIVDWAGDHILGFFVRGLERTVALGQANAKILQDLTSSLDGIPDSVLKTQSAGPLELSPAE